MGRVYKPGDLIHITHHYSDDMFVQKADDVVCLVLKCYEKPTITNEQRGYPLSAYLDEPPRTSNKYDVLMCGRVVSMPLISQEEESMPWKVSIKMNVLSEC
jgi:hypothetical protein